MPRGEYLGEFEQLVLLSVARLEDDAYGMSILEEIMERTGTEAAVAMPRFRAKPIQGSLFEP